MSAFHDLNLRALDGQELPLAPFKGQVVLVVNVASKCGLTPQYAGLEKLYQQYKNQGFSVLGLPCNQFAEQEPDSEETIREFCSLNYGVTFPLGSKLEVNGRSGIRCIVCWQARVPSFQVISPGISRNFSSVTMAAYWRASSHAPRRMIRASFRLSKRLWAKAICAKAADYPPQPLVQHAASRLNRATCRGCPDEPVSLRHRHFTR